MYLAPLNYDRFFKKVFSDTKIAKRFLEDFLDQEIENITVLKSKHKITDDSAIVEFDYRCKIGDGYIIVDMQQWYKPDVVQRFFIYHALNSVLQLEQLQKKALGVESKDGKVKEIKDYREIEPVYTIIWMVDDNLKFDEDYVSYRLISHKALEFIQNEHIWDTPVIKEIAKKREEVLKIISNKTKRLDFLGKNHLIFMFQKNIVKNPKITKYKNWFEFAEKTKDQKNKEEDFEQFKNDKVFLEMMKRLNQKDLKQEDYKYIQNQKEMWEKIQRLEQGYYEDGKEDGFREGREEGLQQGLQQGQKEIVLLMFRKGKTIGEISELTNMSKEQIENMINDTEKK